MTVRTAPRRIEASLAKLGNNLVGDLKECRGVFFDTSESHEELSSLDGMLRALQMIEDVAFNWVEFLLFFDLIPDFREASIVAATEVLARDNALRVERGKCGI